MASHKRTTTEPDDAFDISWVDTLKVSELQASLRCLWLNPRGRKVELVARLRAALESNATRERAKNASSPAPGGKRKRRCSGGGEGTGDDSEVMTYAAAAAAAIAGDGDGDATKCSTNDGVGGTEGVVDERAQTPTGRRKRGRVASKAGAAGGGSASGEGYSGSGDGDGDGDGSEDEGGGVQGGASSAAATAAAAADAGGDDTSFAAVDEQAKVLRGKIAEVTAYKKEAVEWLATLKQREEIVSERERVVERAEALFIKNRRALNEERATMACEHARAVGPIVKLNVGGIPFATRKTTLCTVPFSRLDTMFSGRHEPLPTTDAGEVFLDRNPKHFAIILDWLRDSGSPQPIPLDDPAFVAELEHFGLREAVEESVARRDDGTQE